MTEFKSSDDNMKQGKDEGAKRFDAMKIRWDLIPYDTLETVAEVFTHGASKYEDNNWRKGMSYSRMYGAMWRHLSKSQRGEDLDKDSYCFHLSQVAWGCLCLLHFQMNNIGKDDRVKDLNDPELSYNGKVDERPRKIKFFEIIEYWKKKRKEKDEQPNNFNIPDPPDPPPKRIISEDISICKLKKNSVPKKGEFYKHFKGNIYEIICVSFDTEGDNKQLVTYKNNKNEYWTRPLDMFMEYVKSPYNHYQQIPRFLKLEQS